MKSLAIALAGAIFVLSTPATAATFKEQYKKGCEDAGGYWIEDAEGNFGCRARGAEGILVMCDATPRCWIASREVVMPPGKVPVKGLEAFAGKNTAGKAARTK